MKFFDWVFRCFLPIFCLCGCAINSPAYWQVKIGEHPNLTFSGKGAAAGMMMDTYLGGAGIAVGLAIDEGVAKDIAKNISRSSPSFDIAAIVDAQLSRSARMLKKQSDQLPVQVIIDTYGFHTVAVEGDKVSAWLKIRFVRNGAEIVINYPADFTSPKLAELTEVKTNPDLANDMINDAVARVVSRFAGMR